MKSKPELSADDRQQLREAFEANDGDNNGAIDFVEFMSMLDGLNAGIDVSKAQTGFATVDTNGDGVISFDEFIEWWRAI